MVRIKRSWQQVSAFLFLQFICREDAYSMKMRFKSLAAAVLALAITVPEVSSPLAVGTGSNGSVFQRLRIASSSTADRVSSPSEAINGGSDQTDTDEETNTADFEFDAQTGTITKYTGTAEAVVIPDEINGTEVTAIGKNAFSKNKKLTSVQFASGIRTVGERAFMQCSRLVSLQLNEGLEQIETGAFSGCTKLESVCFPSTLRTVGEMAFAANGSLKEVEFNEGLEIIGKRAFMNCKKLTSVKLAGSPDEEEVVYFPESLVQIGDQAFSACPLAGELIFGMDLGHVGHQVFDKNKEDFTIKIEEGEGNKLYFHDDLFPSAQTVLDIPQDREIMLFARAFDGKEEEAVELNAGTLELSGMPDREELNDILSEHIRLTSGFAVVGEAADGSEDTYVETPVYWELEDAAIEDGTVLNGMFEMLPDESYEGSGQDQQAIEAALKQYKVSVKLQIDEAGDDWTVSDFNYDTIEFKIDNDAGEGNLPTMEYYGVTGFSETGAKKAEYNKNLVLPDEVTVIENGKEVTKDVTGVAPEAFDKEGLESVEINVPDGCDEYIIDTSAFAYNELSSIEIPEGVMIIEAYAFRGNQIKNLYLPDTMKRTGSASFALNEISSLEVSDLVEEMQFDNMSFLGNQMTEVELPYSVKKLQQAVFGNNTGVDGKVQLYTRNPKHLTASTYIVPHSKYHDVVLASGEVDREKLAAALYASKKLEASEYQEESYKQFLSVRDAVLTVFSDDAASQEEIDAALLKLQNAQNALKENGADKSALREVISRLEKLDRTHYTDESFAVLETAILEAEDVNADKHASQQAVDDAEKALLEAEKKLELKEEAKYHTEDFIFKGTAVLGFSESGKEKFTFNKNLVIPQTTPAGENVTEIADKAFEYTGDDYIFTTDYGYSPNGLDSVVIPETVKKIGRDAFKHHKLVHLELPDGLQSIGDMAFNGNQLEEAMIPDSVTEIGTGAFSLNRIKEAKLSRSMTYVPAGIFSRNYTLTEIDLPEGITEIRESAFLGCYLKQIHIPDTVVKIERMAFMAHRMEELTIPSSVKIIGNQAFANNKKFRYLRKLTFSEGLEEIASDAFKSCLIQEVYLPRSLKVLAPNAFHDNMNDEKEVIQTHVIVNDKEQAEQLQDGDYELIWQETNTDALREMISKAEAIRQDAKYQNALEAEKKAFDEAYARACEQLEAPVSQIAADAALKTLENAVSGLNGSAEQPEQPEKPEQPGKPCEPGDENSSSTRAQSDHDDSLLVIDTLGKGSWILDEHGWWYCYPDGSYPKAEWRRGPRGWYYFDASGYMAVGWRYLGGKWYYLNETKDGFEGVMVSGRSFNGWTLNTDGSWDGKPQMELTS